MGILDRIRNRFPLTLKRKRSIFLQDDGRYKTIIATGKASPKGGGGGDRTETLLKKYWNYYQSEGTIFAAVNTTAWNTIMVGYNLTSNHPKTKSFIQRYMDKLSLDLVLLDNIIYTLVYGDSFIEMVRNSKGDVTNLKTVDPTTVVINYNQYGVVESYQQKIAGQLQSTLLKPEDIIHIKFFSNPTTPYGISLIKPSMDTIDRKMAADESLANAIARHGTSKYLVKVGTETEIPPPEIFNDIKSELEDITSINEFIVPGLIDISTIDEKGIQGVEEYFNMFQTQLIIGMLCPEEALGLGRGSTEATATVKQMMYERMVRAFQLRISNQLVQELFNPILLKYGYDEGSVNIRFNSVTDADEAVKAKWLGNVLRGYDIRHGEDKPFTVDEVRAMFGYGPMEKLEGEEPSKKPVPTEEEPPPKEEEEEENEEEEREEPT